MKPAALIAQRMHSLRLHACTRSESVLETVRWMGALQAQDYESGMWAIGARMNNATRVDIEQAVIRREIVRTWPMRGTWHFIPATDARWMQDLLVPRLLAAIRKRSAEFGFDEATVARCRNRVVKALEGGRLLPREKLQRIAQAGVSAENLAGNHLLRRFGNEGLLCNGPMAGKEPTFVLRDEWVQKSTKLDRAAALVELSLRYFRSHGPATVRDFAWWSGLSLGDARTAISAAGTALTRCYFNDCEHWFTGDTAVSSISSVELLPAFDEHLLGYQDRSAVLDAERADSVCPGGNGVFRPTLVVNGRVTGLWKKRLASRLTIEVTPFLPLNEATRRATELAGQRLGKFYGKIATVEFK